MSLNDALIIERRKREVINCQNCGEKMKIHRTSIYYCSTFCFKNRNKIKEKKITPTVNRLCDICGDSFVLKTSHQKRCSEECRKIANSCYYLSNTNPFYIFKRDNFTCIYCGKSSIEDSVKLVIDHIVPFSKGGGTHIFNLITACQDCNSVKNDKELDLEVIERIKKIIIERNDKLLPFDMDKLMKALNWLQSLDKYRSR